MGDTKNSRKHDSNWQEEVEGKNKKKQLLQQNEKNYLQINQGEVLLEQMRSVIYDHFATILAYFERMELFVEGDNGMEKVVGQNSKSLEKQPTQDLNEKVLHELLSLFQLQIVDYWKELEDKEGILNMTDKLQGWLTPRVDHQRTVVDEYIMQFWLIFEREIIDNKNSREQFIDNKNSREQFIDNKNSNDRFIIIKKYLKSMRNQNTTTGEMTKPVDESVVPKQDQNFLSQYYYQKNQNADSIASYEKDPNKKAELKDYNRDNSMII